MASKKPKSSSKSRLRKVQQIAYLEREQAEELKALSERTRIAQQVFLREGVEWVLAKYRKVKS